jgi:hypothetical protein
MELGCVKFGIGCKHFRASSVIFLGKLGNFCCSVSSFGHSVVINEFNLFWILSSGLVICGFSKWNFCNICGSVGRVFGH